MVISDKFPENKLCVDLVSPYNTYTFSKGRPKFNVLLKLFSLNPQAQKFYIMHNKAMTIANLVKNIDTTAYYYS